MKKTDSARSATAARRIAGRGLRLFIRTSSIIAAIAAITLASAITLRAAAPLRGAAPITGERLSAQELTQVFKNIRTLQDGVTSVTARIRQTKTSPLLTGAVVTDGSIMLKKPNLLRLTVFAPDNVVTVVDGQYLWVYRPDKHEAERRRLSEDYGAAQAVKFLSNILSFSPDEIERRFNLTGYKDADGYVFEMTPKSEVMAKFLSRITFSFKEGGPVPYRFEVTGKADASTVTDLSDIKINPAADDGAFSFTLPRNARITNLQDE